MRDRNDPRAGRQPRGEWSFAKPILGIQWRAALRGRKPRLLPGLGKPHSISAASNCRCSNIRFITAIPSQAVISLSEKRRSNPIISPSLNSDNKFYAETTLKGLYINDFL